MAVPPAAGGWGMGVLQTGDEGHGLQPQAFLGDASGKCKSRTPNNIPL